MLDYVKGIVIRKRERETHRYLSQCNCNQHPQCISLISYFIYAHQVPLIRLFLYSSILLLYVPRGFSFEYFEGYFSLALLASSSSAQRRLHLAMCLALETMLFKENLNTQ